MTSLPRLDILLYAHDGRGLGHISRSISIGLSLRRLFPNLKVIVLTGSPYAQMLTCKKPIEIIKLPSYQVTIKDGESIGQKSYSNYNDKHLARIRSGLIKAIILQTRPRCILVDHLPFGKENELLESIQESIKDCIWILGVRAVSGMIKQIQELEVDSSVLSHYTHFFWYGDSKIIPCNYRTTQVPSKWEIEETGYISRSYELDKWNSINRSYENRCGCIVSFTWLTAKSRIVLQELVKLIDKVKDHWGNWIFFLGNDYSCGNVTEIISTIKKNPFCKVEPLGEKYLSQLKQSKFAIIAGGYNSLTDLLWAQTPGIVFYHSMIDKEQEIHSNLISNFCEGRVESMQENRINISELEDSIKRVIAKPCLDLNEVITGSEVAAKRIAEIIKSSNEK